MPKRYSQKILIIIGFDQQTGKPIKKVARGLCLHCSTSFDKYVLSQKFCSTSCRSAHWKSHHRPCFTLEQL